MKKINLAGLLFLLASVLTGIFQANATNFVLFIADDCTYTDLASYGSPNSITPNIDKLASQGMMFNRCFQSAPMCSPTRHNLYTGLYPTKTGAYPNHTFVGEGTKSIVQYLKPAGYRVALTGKRHIAPVEVFDFEYLGGGNKLTVDLIDPFLADVSKNKQPFCLYICSKDPHTPWTKGNPEKYNPETVVLPPFWVDTPETRANYCKYLAEIEYMDSEVGAAMDLLKKYNLEEETVFIFTSEQGNSFPYAKWTCYNKGLHTGFIVRWPGNVKAGSISDCLIDYSDVVPTFLEIAKVEIPENLDGKSMKDVWLKKKSSNKEYSFGIQTTRGIIKGSEYFGIRSVTDGQYRFIMNLSPEAEFKNAVTEGKTDWWLSWLREAKTDSKAEKLVSGYKKRPAFELYDDLKDPFNLNNLIDKPEFEGVRVKMGKALKEWMIRVNDKGQDTEMEALKHQKAGAEEE